MTNKLPQFCSRIEYMSYLEALDIKHFRISTQVSSNKLTTSNKSRQTEVITQNIIKKE